MQNYAYWVCDKIEENQDTIISIEKDINLKTKRHFKIIPYDELNSLFYKIKDKKNDFKSYILILGETIFPKYINQIINYKDLYNIPLTVIYTIDNKESLKKYYETNFLEHKYYNILGIVNKSDQIKEIILKILKAESKFDQKISQINLGDSEWSNDYKNCLTFNYLEDNNQIIFPYLFYSKIMPEYKIENSEIEEFNKFLLENYGKNEEIKENLLFLYSCEDVPNDIIAKYWAKIP